MIGRPPPPTPTSRPSVRFWMTASRIGLVLCGLLIVIGVAMLVTGISVDPLPASFLTLGGLGLFVHLLGLLAERLKLPRRIPLDPDSMRRSRRP